MSEVFVSYTGGPATRYRIELSHDGLNKHRVVKGDDPSVVQSKADVQVRQWEEMWEKKERAALASAQKSRNKAMAEELTQLAIQALEDVDQTLAHTLAVEDAIDWDTLKDHAEFADPRPSDPALPAASVEPGPPDPAPAVQLGFLDHVLPGRRRRKEAESARAREAEVELWQDAVELWRNTMTKHDARVTRLKDQHSALVAEWERQRVTFYAARDKTNAAVDRQQEQYAAAGPEAVHSYCDLVL